MQDIFTTYAAITAIDAKLIITKTIITSKSKSKDNITATHI